MPKTVEFCSHTKGDFRAFSNFYTSPITCHGKVYPTGEHLFQAAKFYNIADPDNESNKRFCELILTASSPSKAKIFGRMSPNLTELRTKLNDREKQLLEQFREEGVHIRDDWEEVKYGIMYYIVSLKFKTHPDLKELLISTGDAYLVEAAKYDEVWGYGRNGNGQNHLGRILMQVRSELLEQ